MKFFRSSLIFILLLAALLRFYQISNVPPSASLDEASIGYNAYSILKTGRDEYGTRFPILLRAFDDYRPALYVYFVVPFVWIFGLFVTSVRAPAVLLSVFDVLLVYLIAKKLFSYHKHAEVIALCSALLLTISPWHIYISRLSHEANLGLFFVILGTYFFVSRSLIFSSIAFALSLYGYQSQKLVVPVLVLSWFILFFRELWIRKQQVLLAALLGVLLAFPLVKATFTPDAMLRFAHTSALAPDDPIIIRETRAFILSKETNNLWGQIWYNRRIVPIKIIAGNYFSHFSVPWLFTGAQSEMFKAPYTGLLYPWELLFILIGLVVLLWKRKHAVPAKIIIPLILTAPLAASFTTMAPHAMRSYTFLPAVQLLEAAGVISLISFLRNRKMAAALFFIIVGVSLGYFSKEYFVTFPKEQSQPYQYALHQAIGYVLVHKSEYNEVVVSIDRDLTESYMFYLFDSKYDPATYQASGGTKSGGFAQWHKIGTVSFRPIVWNTEKADKKILYIGNRYEFGADAEKIASFNYLDGSVGVIATTKPL